MKTDLVAARTQLLKLADTNPEAAAKKLNAFAKDVTALSTDAGEVVKEVFAKLTGDGMERSTLRTYGNIAKFMRKEPEFKNDTEEAIAKMKFPRLSPSASLEQKISTFIRANAGDENYFDPFTGGNLGTHAYIMTGKAADTLIDFMVKADARLKGKTPEFDPKKHVVVGMVETYDEPQITCMILDKATMRPVFVEKGISPANYGLDDMPKSLQKDKRIVSDDELDMFKLTAVLLSPGKKIDLKLKGDDASWDVSAWLEE